MLEPILHALSCLQQSAELVVGTLRFGVCVSSYTFVCLMKRSDSNRIEMQRALLKCLGMSHETNLIVSRYVSDWLSSSLLQKGKF